MIKVEYLRHTGDDLSVVNAARVSHASASDWEVTCQCGQPVEEPCGTSACMYNANERLSAKDVKLVNFLAKHKHKSPFNHAFVTFRIKAPIFVARQLVKHEYMPWNEVSRRYVEGGLDFYCPPNGDWRSQPVDVKQGSGDPLPRHVVAELRNHYARLCVAAEALYDTMILKGLSREQARMVLPQSLMTEWVWSGSLFAFAKMCALRLDNHTQKESQYVAEQVNAKLAELFPVSWAALKEHGAT
ncbi:FAD-dependent thymidylate synthase [Pseudovibrio ascidiaceicola]|uniref:FAD-dependent thymidylate synthase n=1 Tax=Pseudovibrio ascidiaceicola TaxID=285279 RepID=UPI003D36A206